MLRLHENMKFIAVSVLTENFITVKENVLLHAADKLISPTLFSTRTRKLALYLSLRTDRLMRKYFHKNITL